MAEPDTNSRPFWRVRRFWGGLFGVVGTALVSIPGAPALVTIGAIAITTQTAGILLGGIGTYVFGYGQAKSEDRKAAEKEGDDDA